MTSWQEKIELTRYFSSEGNHNDLPSSIELIASIGGIQDFWSFIDLLYINTEDMGNYAYANGLLVRDGSLNFYTESTRALKGNVNSGLKIFIASLINCIKSNSNMYKIFVVLKNKIEKFNNRKSIIIANQNKLSKIISDKINISSSEYFRRKDIAIKSFARNIKSMQSLNDNGKFVYVYLPTRFGFAPAQTNTRNQIILKENLNVSDLYLLEKDYRNSLIEYLLCLNGLEVIDIATIAEENWFFDESHFSAIGHEKIATNLITKLLRIIN